ncbi:integrase arm-type DNA-binding domain-containing protein [Siphonobacter sp. SORGH_AS_1065]|uniref:tyrosine-type recombinase/integrase n=1 Tax=Siphonobacter sp. SORGH_AS_1065 TaxID=3041795 RepID=UPI00277D577D|nr:integrase arm-type DNA-binding domain-containing protein [Siphonobacter sp. SORGH_AS_1065]MDQ1086169.1 integrase [Siphonobacter sp. SORGH_AS_1065]
MALCDLDCRQARPKEKAYRLFDSGGLYLNVMPTGKRVWRLRYYFLGKEKLLTIGPYPVITLSKAREKRDLAKQSVIEGIDPSLQKQELKKLARFKQEQTFELVATEWHMRHLHLWSPNHAKHLISRLKHNAFPFIGKYPISSLSVQHILACIQKVEERERYDLAHRMLQIIGQVMRYAVITGRAERDNTVDLKGALKKYRKGHFAAISSDELPDLLRAIDRNEPRLFGQTILAIKLMLLTFVRTSELINATWNEFDLEKEVWNIPAERMKMRLPHRVPLSKQVLSILRELQRRYGDQGYILPSIISSRKPISNNTVLKGLGRLGYEKTMTGHGFRALAMSTIKENLNYRHEVIDRQLAHQPRNKVDKAYDRAQFLPERAKMMQDWADYIDSLSIQSSSNDL